MIKQLCLNLKIPGNPVLYALRDAGEKDELVTDENLRTKIKDKAALKSYPHHFNTVHSDIAQAHLCPSA